MTSFASLIFWKNFTMHLRPLFLGFWSLNLAFRAQTCHHQSRWSELQTRQIFKSSETFNHQCYFENSSLINSNRNYWCFSIYHYDLTYRIHLLHRHWISHMIIQVGYHNGYSFGLEFLVSSWHTNTYRPSAFVVTSKIFRNRKLINDGFTRNPYPKDLWTNL